MKKFIFTLSILLAFAFVSATFTSCGGGCDEDQAVEDANRIGTLAADYLADITNDEKCQAYVDAVRDFVNDYKDCDDVEQSQVTEIETAISGLPCS